jgi:ribosomal protein L12E/L44/L45/RPP1/RPP2
MRVIALAKLSKKALEELLMKPKMTAKPRAKAKSRTKAKPKAKGRARNGKAQKEVGQVEARNQP